MAQLDASLIGGFKPIDIPDPVNQLTKYLQLSGMQQQNQSGALKLQQDQLAADDSNRIRQYFGDSATQNLDPNALRQGLMQFGPTGVALAGKIVDTQAKLSESGKNDAQAGNLRSESSLRNTQMASGLAAALVNKPDLNYGDIATARQHLNNSAAYADAPGPNASPDDLRAYFKSQASDQSGLTAKDRIELFRQKVIESPSGPVSFNQDNPNAGYNLLSPTGPQGAPSAPSPQTINQPYVGQQPAGNFAGDPAAIYAGLQRIQNPNDRAAALRAFQNQMAGANPTPDASGIFQGTGATNAVTVPGLMSPGQMAGAPPTQAPNPFNKYTPHVDPSTNSLVGIGSVPGSDGKLPVQTLTGTDGPDKYSSAITKALAENRISPQDAAAISRSPSARIAMGEALLANPNYRSADQAIQRGTAESVASGPLGSQLTKFNTSIDHLAYLKTIIPALDNGNFPMVNKMLLNAGVHVGDTPATTYDAVVKLVAPEVIGAITANGGDQGQRDAFEKALAKEKSPRQLANALTAVQATMEAKRGELQKQIDGGLNSGGGRNPPAIKLPPEIQAIIDRNK